MTGLLFVTARSTDVRDLNRVLLYLRDWDLSSPSSGTPQGFTDRFRFVTSQKTSDLAKYSGKATPATFPPLPPSATFANSWVGKSVEEIEQFMTALSAEVQNRHDMHEHRDKTQTVFEPRITRRDSGYSTSSVTTEDASINPQQGGYSTDTYLIVDDAGLATGTAIMGSRQNGTTSWERVRSIPWAEVCPAWKAMERSKTACVLCGGCKKAAESAESGSTWTEYRRSSTSATTQDHANFVASSCRQRDMEVSMWRECGLV